jgi:hypothetical protein
MSLYDEDQIYMAMTVIRERLEIIAGDVSCTSQFTGSDADKETLCASISDGMRGGTVPKFWHTKVADEIVKGAIGAFAKQPNRGIDGKLSTYDRIKD